MDKATLTISLPQPMKDYIAAKLREGRFSTPSEYIRSLIRNDQDLERRPTPTDLDRRAANRVKREK
jgi:antitoxin ParD1/3/4